MSKLGVLCVHGMGNQSPSYADKMIVEQKKRLARAGVNPERVAFKSMYWGDLLDDRQNGLLRRMAAKGRLSFQWVRREIVLSGLGDPAAYLGPGTTESAYYNAIHARMEGALDDLQEMLGGSPDAPLFIVAHSLGCAIASNYLWDAQQETPWGRGTTPFTRGETLSGLLTLGCNLPLFTFTHRPENVIPIEFPGARAQKAFRDVKGFQQHARWLNLYDPDDVLGYPLRPINDAYAKTVQADTVINTGPVWRAHTSYWANGEVNELLTKQLTGLICAL